MNKFKLISFFIGILSVLTLYSQSISMERVNEMREQFINDDEATMRMNAVSSNDIKTLALNRENLGGIDPYFSHKVKVKGITDQKSTGRCWLFTGMNTIRFKIIEEKQLENFSFSHNYNFFYDQLEKANLFLEGIIETADKPMTDKRVEWHFKNVIGDGGQWTGVVNIMEKYGVVPAAVFPESHNSENTSMMTKILRRKLKQDGLLLRNEFSKGTSVEQLRERKEEMLQDVYRILAITLGVPPQTFTWRYEDANGVLTPAKEYTPLSFFEEFVHVEFDDYVMFMNDPSRPYFQLYEIDYDRHTVDGQNWKYINLPTDEIKPFAVESIKDNEAMYFSCDVGKQLYKDKGTLDIHNYDYSSLFGVDFAMNKKERIETFESGSTHGMALVGVDLNDEGNSTKWLLENSWGADYGYNGYLIMTDDWFDEYMFRLVIHKSYISEKILKILDQDPVLLPPWDPMFANEN